MIEAVVPTVRGREHLLKPCLTSLIDHGLTPVVVEDSSSCGEGWARGLERCTGPTVALWSDDFTVAAWDETGVLERLPQLVSPVILNPDLTVQGAGGMGLRLPDGAVAENCICPIGPRHLFHEFQPWPPLNHYCDTWITQRARWAFSGPVVTWGCQLVHHQLASWDPDEYKAWQQWLGRP